MSTDLDHRAFWDAGYTWERYLHDEVAENATLWHGIQRRTTVPDWARALGQGLGERFRLLVISEDWCGDAVNTVPPMTRLAEALGMEMRVVKRDAVPDLMDAYLTNGSRSIPVAIVLDADFRPVGWWGPRPSEVQEKVVAEKRAGIRPARDIYRDLRMWYARDAGHSTMREILAIMGREPAA